MTQTSQPSPHSVHLTVTSVARTVKFYREKLGFKVAGQWPDARRPAWAHLVFGGQSVMVGHLPALEDARAMGMDRSEIEQLKQDAKAFARGTLGAGVLLYLYVGDVDAYHRRLKRKHLRPLTRLRTQFHGLRDFQVEDPDGYRLAFYSRVLTALPVGAGG